MSKALPLGKPLAYGYQLYAYPLSILALAERAQDWILSNFVQVWFDRRGCEAPIPFSFYLYDYALCPWLNLIRMNRSWLNATAADFIASLRDAIDRDYYPYLVVDEFYVPHRGATGRVFYAHDILVHGYDSDAGTFDVIGFDEDFKYRSTTVTFDDLYRAHKGMDDHGENESPVFFFQLREELWARPWGYPMDLDLIRTTTLEYLDGTDTSRHFAMLESRWPWDRAYGTESYPYLVQYLHEYAEGRRLDIRPSHVLWEHKKLSVLRMRRAADLRPAVGELVERAQQLESDAYVLRNAMIRDDILGRRPGFLPKALARLDTIQKTEHQLLTDFAAALT